MFRQKSISKCAFIVLSFRIFYASYSVDTGYFTGETQGLVGKRLSLDTHKAVEDEKIAVHALPEVELVMLPRRDWHPRLGARGVQK